MKKKKMMMMEMKKMILMMMMEIKKMIEAKEENYQNAVSMKRKTRTKEEKEKK